MCPPTRPHLLAVAGTGQSQRRDFKAPAAIYKDGKAGFSLRKGLSSHGYFLPCFASFSHVNRTMWLF